MNCLGVVLNREGDAFIDVEADGVAYFLERDGHLVFDGFDRKVQDLGYFAVFQPVLLYQFEDDLAFGRKLVNRSFYQRDHIGRDQQLLGIEINTGEFCMELLEGIGADTLLELEMVECGVADGDVKIYFQVLYLIEIAALLPNTDEDVRDDLFGRFPGLDHGLREEEQRGIQGREQLLIRLLVIKASNP